MVHGPEEVCQVRINYPFKPLVQFPPYLAQCSVGGPPLPVAVVGIIEYRLEDRFQSVQQRLLTYPVIDRRDTQRTKLARLARLGNQALKDRLRHIIPVPQLPVQAFKVRVKRCLERLQILPIHAPGTPVALHLLPGHLQVLPLVHLVHQ